MAFLPFVAFLVGVGMLSIVVDRRMQARKQGAAAAPEAGTSEATVVDTMSGALASLWSSLSSAPKDWADRFIRKPPTDLPQNFRNWAVQAAGDDTEVADWLTELSDEGLQSFTEHVGRFCADMGFELSWLVEQQFDKNPKLAQDVGQVVLHYCRACRQAAGAQEELDPYKQLLSFEQNPSSKRSQVFGEKLFAKVVEAELTSQSMPTYLAASPKERAELMIEGIREAAVRDSESFNRVLRDVVVGHESAPTASETDSEAPEAS